MTGELEPAVDAAWAYEGLHVNALFREWAGPVLDAARVSLGAQVLDVACGTGVLARAARERVGADGSVTGLDLNPGMLAVAAEIEPGVTWTPGDACEIPLAADEFDAVVSQFGLMFFPDRTLAIREMLRCAKPGAPIAVAVWDAMDRSGAYRTTVELFDRLAGPAAAEALRAPFILGDVEELRGFFQDAEAEHISITTLSGRAKFPSISSMIEAELRGWLPVMGVALDDELIEQILAEAEVSLQEHVTADGAMTFDTSAHIITATAPTRT